MLRSVLQELEEQMFQQCLSTLMVHLQEVAPRFALYFAIYAARATEWAHCYRKGTQANTIIYVETFHSKQLTWSVRRTTGSTL